MQKASIVLSIATCMLSASAAHAGVVLGAGVGPLVGSGPTMTGGSFAGEIAATFPSTSDGERPSSRWGVGFEAGISVLSRSDGKLGGSDLALVSRFQWRVGGVYLGMRAGVAGHFFQFRPDGGQMQAETKQFGFTIGPELAWPISRATSLGARLSYQATNDDVDNNPNGYPPHVFDLFVGISREL